MNEATYCPEDNKLRLYVGRVPREEYLALKEEGWTSTPKQSCDFVAVWSVRREKTALTYADYIGDEDQSPTDRAADRAERFSGYRDNRREEATGYADRYEEQPSVHGYQSQERADRAAARHELTGVKAYTQWEKAEYWQSRTAGVISHALHLCKPSVRMGRIKEIEADMRRIEKDAAEYITARNAWINVDSIEKALHCTNVLRDWHEYKHPRDAGYKRHGLYDFIRDEKDPMTWQEAREMYLSVHNEYDFSQGRGYKHLQLRLAYENQMIDAVGGMAGELEIVVGGRFNGELIYKVNKSNVTGRVTTVATASRKSPRFSSRVSPSGWYFPVYNTEKSTGSNYTPPTPEDMIELEAIKAAIKEVTPKQATIPLINPTDESAAELQKVLNSVYRPEENEPARITQARYSANSTGSYANCEVREFTEDYRLIWTVRGKADAAFKVRLQVRGCSGYRVIILTDKPQKPLPAMVRKTEEVPA